MTLYDYTVFFNPISDWIDATNYFVGNKVVDASVFYKCKLDHLSNVSTNKPPNTEFWDVIVPTNPNTDITNFVETIKETEIGSGEVRSLSLRINANQGAFITNTNSGLTPIIDQFDKISVETVDRNGKQNFSVYEVDIIHPTLDGAIGIVLPVDLLGSEFYLQKTLFADQFFFKSMFTTSKGIVDFYNLNKGQDEVQIIGHDADSSSGGFNDLPVFTANDYTFNINELSHYDGLLEVIDRGGSSVAAGGAGDFFELGFTTSSVNVDQINFRGFSSGNPIDQTSIPNIVNTLSVNPAEQEGEIDATVGNVVGTWCSESIGTLPRQNADFIGALEAWRLFPEHISGATYPQDAIILVINTVDAQGDEFHYKANTETSINPPTPPTVSNADWDQHTFLNFLTVEVSIAGQYSFWTNARANPWKSNVAESSGTLQDDPPLNGNPGSMKVWDSNQVKIDGTFRQTWVDVRALNEAAISSVFKRNGQVYRGFRVLVDGVGTDEFAGFDNDVIQWDGTQWLIFLIPEDNNLVGVDDESRTYQFDSTGVTWDDVTTSIGQANDVYHAVFNITNTQGQNNKNNGAGGNFGEFSAVTFEFRNSITDNFALSSPTFYRQFAGVCFRVPFPFNSNNTNSIGSIYGNNDSRLPATFEAENMGLTASGLSGFNNTEAEDLGPFDALTFFIKHEWRYQLSGSGNLVFFAANFAYRCALYDIDDTVVTQDFVIPFNNLWAPISLPVSAFMTYKARAAWAFGNISQNIFLQELEILNSFRWRNIKKISIHWLGTYDDQGRFAPQITNPFLTTTLIDPGTLLPAGSSNIKVSVDSFQWSKPGLSISTPNTDRPLQPQFFYEPFITNKFQNDQANLAKLEIIKFRHKEFEITTVGLNDLRYGDSFFLENSKLVNDADRTLADLDAWVAGTNYILKDDVQDAGKGYRCITDNFSVDPTNKPPNTEFWDEILVFPIPNTIKLVAKKIVRLIDKVPTGPGGFLRTITGVRRFVEGEE